RELARALLQDPGDPEEVLRALLAGERAPRATECRAGGLDRLVHVGGGGPGDLRQRLLGRRVDRRERLAVRRGDILAADEQPVALLDRDDVTRLGRGRVLPWDRRTVAEPPA